MSSGSTTTVQRNDPYGPAQPLLNEGLDAAGDLYRRGGFAVQPYGGSLVAPYDPMRAAADAYSPYATGEGLGRVGDAYGVLQGAMDGTVLQSAKDRVIADVMPAVNASFSMDGRTGGGLHYDALGEGLARGLSGLEIDAQNRAMQAAGMVPGLNAAGFGALDYLRGAGADRQQYGQTVIAADALQDRERQTVERKALQDYLALTTGVGSTFGVQSATSRNNPGLLGYLGLGMQALPFF